MAKDYKKIVKKTKKSNYATVPLEFYNSINLLFRLSGELKVKEENRLDPIILSNKKSGKKYIIYDINLLGTWIRNIAKNYGHMKKFLRESKKKTSKGSLPKMTETTVYIFKVPELVRFGEQNGIIPPVTSKDERKTLKNAYETFLSYLISSDLAVRSDIKFVLYDGKNSHKLTLSKCASGANLSKVGNLKMFPQHVVEKHSSESKKLAAFTEYENSIKDIIVGKKDGDRLSKKEQDNLTPEQVKQINSQNLKMLEKASVGVHHLSLDDDKYDQIKKSRESRTNSNIIITKPHVKKDKETYMYAEIKKDYKTLTGYELDTKYIKKNVVRIISTIEAMHKALKQRGDIYFTHSDDGPIMKRLISDLGGKHGKKAGNFLSIKGATSTLSKSSKSSKSKRDDYDVSDSDSDSDTSSSEEDYESSDDSSDDHKRKSSRKSKSFSKITEMDSDSNSDSDSDSGSNSDSDSEYVEDDHGKYVDDKSDHDEEDGVGGYVDGSDGEDM